MLGVRSLICKLWGHSLAHDNMYMCVHVHVCVCVYVWNHLVLCMKDTGEETGFSVGPGPAGGPRGPRVVFSHGAPPTHTEALTTTAQLPLLLEATFQRTAEVKTVGP